MLCENCMKREQKEKYNNERVKGEGGETINSIVLTDQKIKITRVVWISIPTNKPTLTKNIQVVTVAK